MSEEKKCRVRDPDTKDCLDEKLKTLEKTPVEVEEPEICYIRDPKTKECLDEEWEMNIESMTEYFPELKGLSKDKASRILEEASESIRDNMKSEQEVRNWSAKFISPKWIKDSKKMIEDFKNTIDDVKGFSDILMTPRTYIMPLFGKLAPTREEEEEKLGRKFTLKEWRDYQSESSQVVAKPPAREVAKGDEEGILKSISVYEKMFDKELQRTIDKWQKLEIYKKNPKEIQRLLIEEFPEYWNFLDTIRNAYVNIDNNIKRYSDFNTIMKAVDDNIFNDILEINENERIKGEYYGVKHAKELGWY